MIDQLLVLLRDPLKWEEGQNPYTQEASVDFAVQLVVNLGYENRKIAFAGVSGGGGIILCHRHKISRFRSILYFLIAPSIRPEDKGPPPIGRHILGSAPGRLFIKIALYQYLPLTLFYHNAQHQFLIGKLYLTQNPILYISGDDDRYLHVDKHREVFDEIASTPTSSTSHPNFKMEFKVINECGHLPQDEKPQEVLNSI
ncbi:unnamed protein product [Rhizophagus irregularis]|nr:unnamed protein product [Rhizophagus irregularis]